MKITGINGSPRKDSNTKTLLKCALEVYRNAENDIQSFDLIDITFSGCMSCFSCKRIENREKECIIKDSLLPVLKQIRTSDILVLAMPIYFGDVPGMVRNLMERLFFPGLLYRKDHTIAFERNTKTLLIYNMNEPDFGKYTHLFEENEALFERFIGPTRSIAITDTKQYHDYSKYIGDYYDPTHKEEVFRSKFPKDCGEVQKTALELIQ